MLWNYIVIIVPHFCNYTKNHCIVHESCPYFQKAVGLSFYLFEEGLCEGVVLWGVCVSVQETGNLWRGLKGDSSPFSLNLQHWAGNSWNCRPCLESFGQPWVPESPTFKSDWASTTRWHHTAANWDKFELYNFSTLGRWWYRLILDISFTSQLNTSLCTWLMFLVCTLLVQLWVLHTYE